jgi:hypothetical protein
MKKQKDIVYKVVYTDFTSITPDIKGIKLKYSPNTIVRAPSGTFGIFCFNSKSEAIDYIDKLTCMFLPGDQEYKLIKVIPIGRKLKTPEYVLSLNITPFHMRKLSVIVKITREFKRGKYNRKYITWGVSDGTVCYQAVKVL